jgi:hypothetical protein
MIESEVQGRPKNRDDEVDSAVGITILEVTEESGIVALAGESREVEVLDEDIDQNAGLAIKGFAQAFADQLKSREIRPLTLEDEDILLRKLISAKRLRKCQATAEKCQAPAHAERMNYRGLGREASIEYRNARRRKRVTRPAGTPGAFWLRHFMYDFFGD